MRNKIIALALTVVMAVLALAGCASSFNYAEEDLSSYATIDVAAFKAALKAIEIEDSDFTTDETVRQNKVLTNILSTFASYAEKNGEQKKDGALGVNDVLYYAYFTTYEIDGKTYSFDMSNLKTTDFTSSTTSVKNSHSISLSQIDVNDKDADKLSVALKKAIEALEDKTVSAYKTVTTAGLSIKDKDNKANYDSIYVAYIREYKENENTTVKEEAKYEKINLTDTEDPLVKKLLDANTTAKINGTVEIKGANNVTEKTFTINKNGVDYKYSNFKVLFAVEEEGKEYVTFKYAPYTKEQKLEPDSLYTDGAKVTIPKDAELTYHVYPVYYYSVSEISATSIIIEALASKITTSSLDILGSEEYKNGDKTVKALVEELVKIHADTSDNENLKNLKKAYDDAAKVVKDAGSKATTEQKDAETKAKEAFDDAKEKAIADKTAEILKATKADADPISDVVVEEYKEDTYHTLKETYDSEIIDKIGAAIWDIVEKNVKVTSYPEALIKEAVAHLENEYEYKFYNENVSSSSTAESNYKAYGGDFDAYMVAVTKASNIDGVPAKLEAEAKDYVKPIIQLYVASKALASDAEANFLAQLKENAFVYEDDEDARDFAYYCAENFVVDNDVLKKYKEIYGQNNYDIYVDGYGESNFRTSLQSNNFFDYLLATKREEKKDGDHSHAEHTYKDGKINFYNIGYVIKADTDGADKDDSAEK